ncbi:MAG TPA: DUF6734 family protein, partial [Fibrobacteria bacterium]|nr:DUF6734 family protein [Fibrobacteria bacterium]
MRAVWSFWSKPFHAFKGRIWHEPKHHLFAWGLSLRLARKHFERTQLVTDSAGKALLVDDLGLEFDEVSIELDSLQDADPGWWALGKLAAYALQTEPFLHLDTDVFLWKAPPPWLLSAPVFAQCPERHSRQHAWCGPREVEDLFSRHGLSLPVEWEWSSSRESTWFREDNCGIVGGNRVDFLGHWARTGIILATDPANQAAWKDLPEKSGFNMLIEQYLLAACLDYHRIDPESPYKGIDIRYLFPTWGEAFDPEAAARVGYTHLLGDAKTNPVVASRLEDRIARMDPGFHRHARRVAAGA